MKKIGLIAVLLLGSTGLFAQEITAGNLGEFNQIVLTGKMNVVLVEGEQTGIEVILHNTEAERFSWSVSESKLNVRLKPNTQRDGTADVKITYKRLNALDVASSSVRNENTISSGIFDLKVANGANVTLQAEAKDITVSADGNSATTLTGNTLYLNISANSKAKIDARAMEARAAFVSTQLGAEVFVWGTEKLEAKAGSNSVIYYKGTPEIFKPTTNLMGSVEQFSY